MNGWVLSLGVFHLFVFLWCVFARPSAWVCACVRGCLCVNSYLGAGDLLSQLASATAVYLDDGRLVPAPPPMPPPPPPGSQRPAMLYLQTPDGLTTPHRLRNPNTTIIRSPDGRVGILYKRINGVQC